MRKFTNYIILLLLSVFMGCSPLRITKIDNNQTIEKNGILFYLPQTELNIVIDIEKQNRADGQFSREAQNLLPIKQKNSIPQWQIKNIQLLTVAQPDSSQCYLLKSGKKISQIQLNDKNILLGFNLPETQVGKSDSPEINNFSVSNSLPDYNDFFIKKNTRDIIDTVYTVVKRDSISYTKRSFEKRQVDKNKTDYANDIYRYLIKVRKHKFRLMAAMDDSSSNANSIKIRFHHLDSLEQALKSLIAGEKIVTPYTFNFRFLPNTSNLIDTLTFFSNIYGINNQSGKPIIIKIEPLQQFRVKFSNKFNGKGIPYRIPQQAIIRLFLGNELIIEKQIPLAQMGQILELPKNVFKNTKTTISYNPLTGQITGLSNQK